MLMQTEKAGDESMKNILIIQGGGRPKGNTEQLIGAFVKGAEEAGHKTEALSLLQQEVKGCLGCNVCRQGRPCVQQDAFHAIVPKIQAARLKAFIERFYSIAQRDPNPPLGRYEKYPEKECALLMTAADNLFWTFEQAAAYYRFALVRYIGLRDKGMVLAGGCGGSSGKPEIDKTDWLQKAYEFGKTFD